MRPSTVFLFVTTLILAASPAWAADDETAAEVAQERAELITQTSPERAEELKRKAKKALEFVHKMGRHMEHRIVTINTDALKRLDPMPDKPKEGTDDPSLALVFEMTFSPTENETYVLKNEKNFRSEFFGQPIIMWQGVLESTDGEVLGEFMLSDMNGKFDVSGFGFEGRDFGWGFRDIEGEPETTVVKMSKPKK